MKNKMNNKPRKFQKSGHHHGGHSHSHHNHGDDGGHRPRRNAGAAREKYLAMARDAMASGDRVLAENYYQHADHYYRIMAEDGFRPRQPGYANGAQQQPQQRNGEAMAAATPEEGNVPPAPVEQAEASGNFMPAFLQPSATESMQVTEETEEPRN